jgi:hypothetical protein
VSNSEVPLAGQTATHGPGQWSSNGAGNGIDANLDSYSESGSTANPMWQTPIGISAPISSVQVRLRPNRCAARTFQGSVACSFGTVPVGSPADRNYDAANEGATIRVSTTACVAGAGICPGTICGRINRPSATGYDYTVTCATPITGSFVSIQLPGSRRIQQVANVIVNRDVTQPTC